MEKHEDVVSILSKLNLENIETTISQPYIKSGAGRPPRNPLGIFKALLIKQLRRIPSDKELYRRLWNDETLRIICDIEEKEKPYHPSQLTRFRNKVGPERLEDIIQSHKGTSGGRHHQRRDPSPRRHFHQCLEQARHGG